MRPVFGAAAALVVAMMVVGAFSMWTVIPFGWIWIGSKVSHTQQPSGGPYMVVFFGIVISICTMAWILSRLNRVYVRLTGSSNLAAALPAGVEEKPERRAGELLRAVGARGRDPGLGAAGGRGDGDLVLHRRRLPAPLAVAAQT